MRDVEAAEAWIAQSDLSEENKASALMDLKANRSGRRMAPQSGEEPEAAQAPSVRSMRRAGPG